MKSNVITRTNGVSKSHSNGKSVITKQNTNNAKNSFLQKIPTTHSSKEAQGLKDLFEDSLKDIYWAEKALIKALPKMAKNAISADLVTALKHHLNVTQSQVGRLEQVFELLGKVARAKKCEAMEGLIKEDESIMKETAEGVVIDAGIIMAGQKVEHYEIATYGTLCAFAKLLGEGAAAKLLQQSLGEERDADNASTELAESSINIAAADEFCF